MYIQTAVAVNFAETRPTWRRIVASENKVRSCCSDLHSSLTYLIRLSVTDPTTVLGTGRDAGADEDDFHMFKRNTTAIERDEKHDTKLKEMLDIRAGALSGSIKPTGIVPQLKKKIIVFK